MIVEQNSAAAVMERNESEVKIPKRKKGYLITKRCFDFVSSLCVSLALIVPLAGLCLMVMIKDPGSPFYMQKRVGKDGKEIGVLKLRSMRKGADRLEEMLTPEQLEQYKKEYKLDDDPRLIGYKKAGDGDKCFGAMIRRTSLDELPQIVWNICIKGDMSVVGPRPILQDELEEHYTAEEQKLLLSVKPGLTGYWQAYARNNAHYENGERQKMELYYINNCSTLLDMKVIIQTVRSVLARDGAK